MANRVSSDEYMNPYEFSKLTSDVHHAVWRAVAEHRIDWVPYWPSQPGGIRRYRRAQVRAIAAGLKEAS